MFTSSTSSSRFSTTVSFAKLSLSLITLQEKKDELYKIVDALKKERISENKKIATTLDEKKYIIMSSLNDRINLLITKYNETTRVDLAEDKLDQFLLADKILELVLETIKTNVEILMSFRNYKKPLLNTFFTFGSIAGSATVASSAAYTWPGIVLASYLGVTTCSMGLRFAGYNPLTKSMAILFEIMESLKIIFEDTKSYIMDILKEEITQNYYEILGLSVNASREEIVKSYRQLALQYHPDKQNISNASDEIKDATVKFIEITKAYQVLSDPEEKAKYDSLFLLQTAYKM